MREEREAAHEDQSSFMQVLYKVNAVSGMVHFKQVEEISPADLDEGWKETGGSSLDMPSPHVAMCLGSGREGSESEEGEDEEEEEEEEEEGAEYVLVASLPVLAVPEALRIPRRTPDPVRYTAQSYLEEREPSLSWYSGDLLVEGRKTKAYHGQCTYHSKGDYWCPLKYRARLMGPAEMERLGFDGAPWESHMVLEKVNDHDGESDEEVKKKALVKEYAKFSPKVAERKLSAMGVKHGGEWLGLLKGARYRAAKTAPRYDGEFVGTMERFCAHPPPAVTVMPGSMLELTPTRTQIVFYNAELLAEALARIVKDGKVKLVADGTYKTNKQRLVLVGLGAVYLVVEGDRVHNRFVPLMFCLADAEDHLAYASVIEALLEVAQTSMDV